MQKLHSQEERGNNTHIDRSRASNIYSFPCHRYHVPPSIAHIPQRLATTMLRNFVLFFQQKDEKQIEFHIRIFFFQYIIVLCGSILLLLMIVC